MPGIDVEAGGEPAVAQGETVLEQLKAADQLGAVVIVGLGTNGPITASDFDAMMSILSGASRVVFVNVSRRPPLAGPEQRASWPTGVPRYHNAVLADWYTLASQHPDMALPTRTHLPIDGPGAQALAALVATRVT